MKNKKIKLNVLFSLVCGTFLSCASHAKVEAPQASYFEATLVSKSSSNIVFISRADFYESEQNKLNFWVYDLSKNKSVRASIPSLIEGRNIVGLYPVIGSETQVYVLSQLQKAGADKPQIDLYNSKTKKWKSIRSEINCVSFSKLRVIKGQLKMNCREHPLHSPDKKELSFDLKNASDTVLANSAYKIEIPKRKSSVEVTDLKASKKIELKLK